MTSNNATKADALSKTRTGYLTDHNGKPSAMRLMSFTALGASVWFGWLTINDANPTAGAGVYLTSVFLVAAFAPKSVQKFIELSYPTPRLSKEFENQ